MNLKLITFILSSFFVLLGSSQPPDSQTENSAPQPPSFDLPQQQKKYQLTEFKLLNISETLYKKAPAIQVIFSVPIDALIDFQPFLSIKNNSPINTGWILSPDQTKLYFTNIEPEQEYKITIDKNIQSINRQKLPHEILKTILTRPLSNEVSFVNQGRQLPRDGRSGLLVASTNIKHVDINFHRFKTEYLNRALRDQISGGLYYLQRLPQETTLAYTGRFRLNTVKNTKTDTIIPVQNIASLKQPGLYMAVMSVAGEYAYQQQVQYFYVSDIALHIRQYAQTTHLLAVNINDGQPVRNAQISILNSKGSVKQLLFTDSLGQKQTKKLSSDKLVMVTKGEDVSVITLSSPDLDLSDQLSNNRIQSLQQLFLYGPRDLYRPGETITINGLLRGIDGEHIADSSLAVTLIQPDGRILKEFDWFPQQKGFYQKKITLNETAMTGSWQYQVVHPSGTKFSYPFLLEQFLPETMKLQLTRDQGAFIEQGQSITIDTQGDFLYGAPAANQMIRAKVMLKPEHKPIKTLSDYYFGIDINDRDLPEQELPAQNLDQNGSAQWRLPNIWSEQQYPTQIVFESSLLAANGRPLTRRLTTILWPQESFIGIRPSFDNKFAQSYTTAAFEIIRSNQQGELLPINQLEVSLVRQNSRYYWFENDNGWDFSYNSEQAQVYSQIIDSPDTKVNIDIPLDYGMYQLQLKDNQGQVLASYGFKAGWQWDPNLQAGIEGLRPDQVRLNLDQASYKGGDIAKLTINAPNLGQAYIRVEADQLLWQQQIDLQQHQQTIDIPIDSDWQRHDIYISAMLIAKETTDQQPGLKRSLGVIPLTLDRSQRMIPLTIEAPQIAKARGPVNIKIKTAAALSQAQKTWVTLAGVDTGVLSLTSYQTPKPHGEFYGQKSYAVAMKDSFSQLIRNPKAPVAQLKFGGDASLSQGGTQPVSEVQIVSLFSAPIEFNSAGEAEITLELPDFNGELRLMALAFSDDQFGSSEQSMIVRSPLVVELSMPRFLTIKDQSQVVLSMQNLSGQKQKLQVDIAITGGISTPESQVLTLPLLLEPEQSYQQIIPITAMHLTPGKIAVVVTDIDNQQPLVNKSWLLGTRHSYPAISQVRREVIQTQQTFELAPEWISTLEEQFLQSKINIAATPHIDAGEKMAQLFHYAYGCLEQTSSRAWPLLLHQPSALDDTMDERSQEMLSNKNQHINGAIEIIIGMQRSDGSFGLWNNQSNENHWLTVYAMEFLLQARQAGYAIANTVMDKGLARLQTYINSTQTLYSEANHYSQDSLHYSFSFRAYGAYLLSRYQPVKLSQLRQIKTQYLEQAKTSLSIAHLAAAFENTGDISTAKALWQQAIDFKYEITAYLGDYSSDIRDIAGVIYLASESPLNLDYHTLFTVLQQKIRSRNYFSTQENFALYRLTQVLLKQNNALGLQLGSLSTNIQNLVVESGSSYQKLITAQDFKQHLKFQLTQGETAFINLQVIGYPLESPKAVNHHIYGEKQFYNLSGEPIALERAKSGDYVLVRLMARADENIPDALVIDFVPAGFELENPSLAHSLDYSQIKIENKTLKQWQEFTKINHSEYRDDRFVSAVAVNNNRASVLFYVMRAVTPGVYQVPPLQIEDMYRPEFRSITGSVKPVIIDKF